MTDANRTNSGPRVIRRWFTHCWCKQMSAPWFDCPKHRTKTRGYCGECFTYNLVYRDGQTFCGDCGRGPLAENPNPRVASPRLIGTT